MARPRSLLFTLHPPPPTQLSTLHCVTAHISFAAAQSIRNHFYLAHYTCLPAPYLPILSHTHAAGLRFQGSYDTIQIHLAAYSREICFALSYFPQKSRFPCLAALIHMASGPVSTAVCFSSRARQSLIGLCHCWWS